MTEDARHNCSHQQLPPGGQLEERLHLVPPRWRNPTWSEQVEKNAGAGRMVGQIQQLGLIGLSSL